MRSMLCGADSVRAPHCCPRASHKVMQSPVYWFNINWRPVASCTSSPSMQMREAVIWRT